MTEGSKHNKDHDEQSEAQPKLVPPDAMQREQKQSAKGLFLVLGGGLVLILAAALVLFLPLRQEEPGTPPQSELQATRPAKQPSQQQNQAGPSQVTAQQEGTAESEKLLEKWLQKQAAAEAENVSAWGGESYAQAVTFAEECNRLLGKRQSLAAAQSCQAAISSLDKLMASRDRLLEEALAAGEVAIEQSEPQAAVTYFKQALAIDAAEQRAVAGMQRAEQLPAVLQFLQDGLRLEGAGDLEGALLALNEATGLDPEFKPAREALARVTAAVAERDFQQTVSRALQAMAEGKLSVARTALQKAETIKPGDSAVKDLKWQLDQTRLAGKLASLRQEANRLEEQERWSEALQNCEQALSLDPNAAFAVSCKERVGMRVGLDNRLQSILAQPERLFEEGPRQEARRILAHAFSVSPRGQRLAAQIDKLERLITRAEAKVDVVLISDNMTEVTIHHVGRLGRFEEKHLVLRTGNYVATGSRDGFRDIRQTLEIRPESGKQIFTLRCEEPI